MRTAYLLDGLGLNPAASGAHHVADSPSMKPDEIMKLDPSRTELPASAGILRKFQQRVTGIEEYWALCR